MENRTPMDERAVNWVRHWQNRLGIDCSVRLERASIWQVMEGGRRGGSLVGVTVDADGACIYHTRRLTEEDIVHELLHVAYPAWTEAEVVAATDRLLAQERMQYRVRRATQPHAASMGGALLST